MIEGRCLANNNIFVSVWEGGGGVAERLDKRMRSKISPCIYSCTVSGGLPRGNFENQEGRRSHLRSFCNAIKILNLRELCLFADVSEEKLSMPLNVFETGRASSVGCAYCLVSKRWRVRSSSLAHSFMEIWSWKKFYDHSLPSADSRRAVVSYWQKNVH